MVKLVDLNLEVLVFFFFNLFHLTSNSIKLNMDKSKRMKIVLVVISSILILIFYNLNKPEANMTAKESVYSIEINDLNGNAIDFNNFKGKKILIVHP